MRKLFLPVFAIALVLLVACGGGKKDDNATTTSGGSGTATSETLDLTRATQKLTDVRSFRFDLKLKLDMGDLGATSTGGEEDEFGAAFVEALLALFSDIQAEGSYAGGNVDVKLKLLGEEMRYIQIGDKAWVNDGGKWEETEPGDTPIGGSPMELLDGFLPEDVLAGAKVSKENVNGVATTRYSFDKDSLKELAEKTGEVTGDFDEVDAANLDVWLTADGLPVKIVMDLSGKDESGSTVSIALELNVRDVNSDSIKITAPI